MAFSIEDLQDLDLLQEAFDAISDFILVISPNYQIMLANRAFCNNYGLTDEDVIGTPYYRIVHGHDNPREDCSCTKTLTSTIYEESEFTRFKRIFATSATPIFEDGRIGAIVHTIKDITLIRQGARRKAIFETTGAVCHEMTQPMQIISANVSLLLGGKEKLPSEIEKRLSIIEGAVNDMGNLTRKLQKIGLAEDAATMQYMGEDRILDLHGEEDPPAS